MRRNLELKARCPDLAYARAAAVGLGAEPVAILLQEDTFFPTARGRLKLREIAGAQSELIAYERPNREGARISEFRIVPAADGLKEALTDTLGVHGIVRKRRELLMWRNVRIHLDEVEELGRFIEFEAVLGPDDDEGEAHGHLAMLADALRIGERVATSYMEEIDAARG